VKEYFTGKEEGREGGREGERDESKRESKLCGGGRVKWRRGEMKEERREDGGEADGELIYSCNYSHSYTADRMEDVERSRVPWTNVK